MKKILSLVLVLTLCFAMAAMAEPTEPTAVVPSREAGELPVFTEEDNVEYVEDIVSDGPSAFGDAVNVAFAPVEAITSLIKTLRENVASVFANSPEVYQRVADKNLLTAVQGQFNIIKKPAVGAADQSVKLAFKAPKKLPNGAKVVNAIGVKDVYGEYVYSTADGEVVDSNIETNLAPEQWQAIDGQPDTQIIVYAD